jgi:hypothetical protein
MYGKEVLKEPFTSWTSLLQINYSKYRAELNLILRAKSISFISLINEMYVKNKNEFVSL